MSKSTRFLVFLTFFFYSAQSFSDCDFKKLLEQIPNETLLIKEKICAGLPPINTKKELKDILNYLYKNNKKNDNKNRHRANRNLNDCRPNKESKVLIIAFEGTGSYDPLVPPTMASFNKCFAEKLNPKLRKSVYSMTREIHAKEIGRDAKWSGLQDGIMTELFEIKNSKNVDWYSFPSEEVEQLAGLEQLKNFSLPQLYRSIKDSVNSNPQGIKNARDCIKQYLSLSQKGKEPKIVLVSHSSGGRSVVKFAEHLKKDLPKINLELAFTIDPVIEAHHAIEEVLPQKIGEPIRYAKWKLFSGKGADYPYSAVWHRDHPSKLYSPSNIEKHINFYQLNDRLGLKMGGDALRFGIQGSNVKGADKNILIRHLGSGAHGDITYQSKVLKMFHDEMDKLLGN